MAAVHHHFATALLPDGWAANVRIGIQDGLIASVAPGVPAEPDDIRAAIAIPGLPNLHSHAFQRGMAGLAERRGPGADTFWTWREVMYRFALTMTPDDVEAVAALLYLEMLEAGFTRVGEFHYLHHDHDGTPYADRAEMAARIVAAAGDTGIGLTLLPVFYAHADFGGTPPTPGQRRFICDVDGFADLMERSRAHAQRLPGARVGLAPHSLRAVAPDELAQIRPLAEDGPIHIHAAEQVREVEACLAWSGRRPVEWLLDEAGADQHWCFIHATHMTDAEARRMAQAGVIAGLCPITEANLGDGIFNARPFRAAGGRFGIGSDSNIWIGLDGELRQFEYAQRLAARERNVLADAPGASTGRSLFEAALDGGAHALGPAPAGLQVGASADWVTLDPNHRALIGRNGDALLDGLIFASVASPIDTVTVRGVRRVDAGRHHARDAILARYRATLTRLVSE